VNSSVVLCAFVAVRSPLLDHFKNSRAIARQQHRFGREATFVSLGGAIASFGLCQENLRLALPILLVAKMGVVSVRSVGTATEANSLP
jgi:hypothetical protein